MTKVKHNQPAAKLRKLRVRGKMSGSKAQPRLSVHRTNRYLYLQVIDDSTGKTIAAASDRSVQSKKKKAVSKTESAVVAAQSIAEQLKKQKVKSVIFDRGSLKYHGRIKAAADELRSQGIVL